MPYVNISVDAGDARVFDDELWHWHKESTQSPHSAIMPSKVGPFPNGQCIYRDVPEPFLAKLNAKGISYMEIE